MKKILSLFTIAILFSMSAYTQILKPITWSYASKKISATEAVVYLKATLEPGWHLYSQKFTEGGPVETSFAFSKDKSYELVGKTIEPKPITKFEPVFFMEVRYFDTSAVFEQKIKLKDKNAIVKGHVRFMVCNDVQCLPPQEVEFSVEVK